MLFVYVLFASFVSAALAESRLDEQPSSSAQSLSEVSGEREKRGTYNVCPRAPLRNLALKRPAFQSDTLTSCHKGYCGASYAVDGVRQAHWVPPYCAHTNLKHNPYWYVDLGEEHLIERVEVVKQADYEVRFRDISVVVAKDDGRYDQTCGYHKSPVKGVPVATISCPANTCGRYVKIQMTTSPAEYLVLCEVEVYGY